MKTLAIVDDEPTARRLLYHVLKDDYAIVEAGDGSQALELVRSGRVDLVLLDLHLPPHPDSAEEGARVHRVIRESAPLLPVVVVTGDQDRSLALEMVRQGVADFLLKPIDPVVLKIVVARALERAALETEIRALREELRERFLFGNLVGHSPAMRAVFAHLGKLAGVSTSVLLTGESGTGKSVVARALHQESPRRDRPFVVVDGATLPESLLESELFGHARGAYTGADASRVGRIEAADGGTLFLDEIGNLSAAAQAKLLLFLDTHSYTSVGSNKEVEVDVRLVAATNRDLGQMVAQGSFRDDLLYRLQVATVELPPLRERRECIAPLTEFFLAALARETGEPRRRLTAAALELLESYPWPGNVRQLRHALEASLVLADGERIDAGELVLPPLPADHGPAGPPGPFKETVAGFERRLLRDALAESGGNKAAAGRLLGLDENQIRYLCRKHGLG